MTPGEVIRTLRIELDLSLREVSRGAGMSSVRLGEIERGVVGPGLFTEEVKGQIFAAMARLVEPRAKQRASLFRKRIDEVTR